MPATILIPLALLTIAADGIEGTPCTDRVIVRPNGRLTTAVSVTLDIEIWTLTSPPHMEVPTQVTIDGNNITVDIHPDGGPIDSIGFFVENVGLGLLSADTYTLTVVQHETIDCGEQITECAFCVEDVNCSDPSCQCPDPVRPHYAIIDLETLGGGTANALAVNEMGQVAGSADTTQGHRHAYLWHGGMMTDLGTLDPFLLSEAWGLSDAGHITGIVTTNGFDTRGFLWQAGAMTDIGDLGGPNTNPKNVNAAGQITGASDTTPTGPGHAFLWESGAMQDLGALGDGASGAWGINEPGQVVGCSYPPPGETGGAFIWDEDDGMTHLGSLGGVSCAFAVNDAAQVVGRSGRSPTDPRSHACRWDESGLTDIGQLGNYQSSMAWGINNPGQVVGWGSAGAMIKPFVHDHDIGLCDLRDLLPVDSGWFWLQPRDINDAGQIVGSGIRQGYRGFLMTPVDADFDDDGDTDMSDLAEFQKCFTGPGVPLLPECQPIDIDRNGQIDIDDFRALHLDFTGPK